jgi:hypothetical protein
MRLVLYLGWPCALALVVGIAGLQLGADGVSSGRRVSTTTYGKYEALSVCVQSVTGERREADLARELVASSLDGVSIIGARLFTLPAQVDVGCPRDPVRYGANTKARRVARRADDERPQPSPYHLHIFLMPPASLQVLNLEPDLADRRVVVEEYVVEGTDASAVMNAVTYGLYTTPDEIGDALELSQFFRHALQLQTQLGAPPGGRS